MNSTDKKYLAWLTFWVVLGYLALIIFTTAPAHASYTPVFEQSNAQMNVHFDRRFDRRPQFNQRRGPSFNFSFGFQNDRRAIPPYYQNYRGGQYYGLRMYRDRFGRRFHCEWDTWRNMVICYQR